MSDKLETPHVKLTTTKCTRQHIFSHKLFSVLTSFESRVTVTDQIYLNA